MTLEDVLTLPDVYFKAMPGHVMRLLEFLAIKRPEESHGFYPLIVSKEIQDLYREFLTSQCQSLAPSDLLGFKGRPVITKQEFERNRASSCFRRELYSKTFLDQYDA
jgi:hypothetical protein